MKFKRLVLGFFFPKKCLGCGKRGEYFCPVCVKEVKALEKQVFYRKPPLDVCFSIFTYEGIIRKAILQLKYQFVSDLVDELVNLTDRFFKTDLFDFSNCLVLAPVPLHWYRQNWRGFNQSLILGKKLAQKLKINFCSDLLIRTRATKPQVKLEGKQRKENIKGAFQTNPDSKFTIYHSEILLFDDIWTTGATMKECARILKESGAKKVFGLTLAR